MHTTWHALLSLPLVLAVHLLYQSVEITLLCFLASFAIDLDHPIDYFLHYGSRVDLKKLLNGTYFDETGKAYVVFHSYELLIPLWAILPQIGMKPLAVGFTIGFLAHLLIDIVWSKVYVQGFSLTYRIVKKFDLRYICKDARTIIG